MVFSYIEWGVFLLTIFFLFWKFGWSVTGIIKSIRKIYKRLEVFLTNSSLDSNLEVCEREVTHKKRSKSNFLNIPVTRTQFFKRNYNHDSSSTKNEHPAFYKDPTTLIGKSRTTTRTHFCSACFTREKNFVNGRRVDASIDLRNCLEYETQLPHNPWYVRRFANLVFFWRKWYIGPQYNMLPFKAMLKDERVNNAILQAAKDEMRENPQNGTLDLFVQKYRLIANKLILNMRARQGKDLYFSIYTRFASWIIGKTLGRIYPSVSVRKSQLDMIKEARKTGYTILYLPIHRSHVDYVLVSWVLAASDIRAPLVAAGDNLNIPIFHLMMRSVGGFFIKRRLERNDGRRDMLYRSVLHSYMERSIMNDNDLEFFIEGGRTRTGKPCSPKGGLLSIAMDSLLSRKVEDILIVPVNFSYDKLLEGNYIREQLGKSKMKESFFTAALGLWNSVQTKFGNARIDFGNPFSVKEFMSCYKLWKSPNPNYEMCGNENYITESDSDQNNNNKQWDAEYYIEDRRDFINNLAQHVIYDGVKNLSLMSTNIVAFLLLNKFRNGVTLETLCEEMKLLKKDLDRRNHDLTIDNDMKNVVKHSLTILGPNLIRREFVKVENTGVECSRSIQMFLRPVTQLPNVIELSYYSTCLAPIYAMEAVIATSILVIKGKELRESEESEESDKLEITVSDTELILTCIELCAILQYEFIFHPPCQTPEESVRLALKDLEKQDIINFNYEKNNDGQEASLIVLNRNPESYKHLQFLNGIIAPILDTYAVSSLVLTRLVGCEALEKHLQTDMLAEVKSHLQQHYIKYGESLALDPIRNFVKVLVAWEVLKPISKDFVTTYVLHDAFDIDEAIDDVVKRVRKFQL